MTDLSTQAAARPAAALLETRPHFEVLDGLRGVAALCVVTFHFMEMAISDYSRNFIGHGFLAVDFFFCLSGFVIGYAYDERMPAMGAVEFLKSRLIRLHPLVLLGSVLGLLALLFDPFTGPYSPHWSAGRLALLFLTSALLVPYPVMAERSFNLFTLNAPSWSLFWEYVANIVYALLLYRLSRRVLAPLLAVALAVLCVAAVHDQSLMGGWGLATFWSGGARVAYSFLAGLLVYRMQWRIRNPLGFAGMTLLLLAALMMPYFKWNVAMELLVVVVYFPLLVAMGAATATTPRSKAICVLAGDLSYPLYMTHYAVIWMFANYDFTHHPGGRQLAAIVIVGVLSLTGVAYLAMVGYDKPVRRYLTARRRMRLASRNSSPER